MAAPLTEPGRPVLRHRYRTWLGLLVALVVAIAFRANAGMYRDLWEDEIIAVTHALQPFWQIPIEVGRYDVHPFLYFFQLHLWSALGVSDFWFKANSIFWNLAAIGSIGVVGRWMFGPAVGLAAAILLALLPPSVWIAQEVRPYAWLYFLMVWNFYAIETACRSGFRSWPRLAGVLALSVCIVYSHAIGFLVVFLFGLYALFRLIEHSAGTCGYRNWLLVFAAAGLLAIPPLAVDLLRDANLPRGDALTDFISWLPRMLLPRGDETAAILLADGMYVAVAVAGLSARQTRAMTAGFLVLPLALAVALDAVGMTVFKPNIFSTIAAPFMALVIARLAAMLRPLGRDIVIAVCASLFILGAVDYLDNRVPTTGYRATSRLIRANQRAGDLVYVPQPAMFWGMARYLVGPEWGSVLAINAPPSATWRKLYDRLGPRLVALLRLEPTTQVLTAPDGLPLLVGTASPAQTAGAKRVWLVTYVRADLPENVPPPTIGTLKPGPTTVIGFLNVTVYE